MSAPDHSGPPPGFFIPDDDEEWGLVPEEPAQGPSEDEVRATVAAVLNRPDFEEIPVGTSFKIDDDLYARHQQSMRAPVGVGLKLAVAVLALSNIGTAALTFSYWEDAKSFRTLMRVETTRLQEARNELDTIGQRLADTDKALTVARHQVREMRAYEEQKARSAKALKTVRYEDGDLSLELEGVNLRDALQRIGKVTGMSLLVSPEVTGRVSASLKAVPLMDALPALIKSVGPYVLINEKPNLLEVVPLEQCERRLQSTTILMHHIAPPAEGEFELFQALRGIIDASPVDNDSIQYDSQSNAFVIRATAPMISELREIVRELDRAAQIRGPRKR